MILNVHGVLAEADIDFGTLTERILFAVAHNDVVIGHVVDDLDLGADDGKDAVKVSPESAGGVEGRSLSLEVDPSLAVHSREHGTQDVGGLGGAGSDNELLVKLLAGVGIGDRDHVGGVQIRPGHGGVGVGGIGGLREAGDDTKRHLGAGAVKDGLVKGLGDRAGKQHHDLLAEVDHGILKQRVADGDIAADLVAVEGDFGELDIELVEGAAGLSPYGLGHFAQDGLTALARKTTDANVAVKLGCALDGGPDHVEHFDRDQNGAVLHAALGQGADFLDKVLNVVLLEEAGARLEVGEESAGFFIHVSDFLSCGFFGFGSGFLFGALRLLVRGLELVFELGHGGVKARLVIVILGDLLVERGFVSLYLVDFGFDFCPLRVGGVERKGVDFRVRGIAPALDVGGAGLKRRPCAPVSLGGGVSLVKLRHQFGSCHLITSLSCGFSNLPWRGKRSRSCGRRRSSPGTRGR